MFYYIVVFFAIIGGLNADEHERTPIQTIVIQFAEPLVDWVGFNRSALEVARQCDLDRLQQTLIGFHRQLAEIGQSFTREHIDYIRKIFSQKQQIKNFFKCVTEKRNTQNQFFKQTRKFKYLAQFIKEYTRISQQMFYADDKPIDKGYRLGRFFRAFFEYYYQHVLYPAETASTKLIRAMTTKIDLFNHQDISNCLSLQTSGKLSQKLQNLGIHNLYIHVPQAFTALKYMKFKDKCKTQKHIKMLDKIHKSLQKLDMFKIMYHEYNPWVQIAAEKYGNRQIQYIAQIFARIINNIQHYEQLSALQQM